MKTRFGSPREITDESDEALEIIADPSNWTRDTDPDTGLESAYVQVPGLGGVTTTWSWTPRPGEKASLEEMIAEASQAAASTLERRRSARETDNA
jgi:hypothetical protein